MYLRLFTSKATTVAEAKEYIKNNPFTVYYELATPIGTEITPNMILINGEPITDTVDIELPNGTKDSIENGCYVKKVKKVVLMVLLMKSGEMDILEIIKITDFNI